MHNNFPEQTKELVETLERYLPIVARVHGEHHAEIVKLQRVLESMLPTLHGEEGASSSLSHDFERLRALTANYAVPDDVCESYELVFTLLEKVERAYL